MCVPSVQCRGWGDGRQPKTPWHEWPRRNQPGGENMTQMIQRFELNRKGATSRWVGCEWLDLRTKSPQPGSPGEPREHWTLASQAPHKNSRFLFDTPLAGISFADCIRARRYVVPGGMSGGKPFPQPLSVRDISDVLDAWPSPLSRNERSVAAGCVGRCWRRAEQAWL